MRELDECRAEVFRRSERRIIQNRKRRKRILFACLPLLILTVLCSVKVLPAILPASSAYHDLIHSHPESSIGATTTPSGTNDGFYYQDVDPHQNNTQTEDNIMKNKVWIPVIAVLLLLAILFAPILQGTAEDGGTRVYRSLTYKLVKWNRIMPNDIYRSTRFYFGKDMKKSLDELWEMEKEAYLLTSDEWLDRSKEPAESPLTLFLTVTEVHTDHIIARTSLDSEQYLIKINGTSDVDFCVGDSVYFRGENCFIDRKNHRIEADNLSAFTDISASEKPVIYLYPEEETDVTVSLTFNGKLTCTYPAYKDGWRVTATPDGTLTDKDGKQYSYLYWEGVADTEYDVSRGFCVRGEDTATFLEDTLASLGLNRREANEFIVYWLPKMQDNEYNIISFQGEVYESNARLDITPAPDTIIRVFMAWQSSDTYVAIQPQELTAPARTGFTVIEWGGADIS